MSLIGLTAMTDLLFSECFIQIYGCIFELMRYSMMDRGIKITEPSFHDGSELKSKVLTYLFFKDKDIERDR